MVILMSEHLIPELTMNNLEKNHSYNKKNQKEATKVDIGLEYLERVVCSLPSPVIRKLSAF